MRVALVFAALLAPALGVHFSENDYVEKKLVYPHDPERPSVSDSINGPNYGDVTGQRLGDKKLLGEFIRDVPSAKGALDQVADRWGWLHQAVANHRAHVAREADEVFSKNAGKPSGNGALVEEEVVYPPGTRPGVAGAQIVAGVDANPRSNSGEEHLFGAGGPLPGTVAPRTLPPAPVEQSEIDNLVQVAAGAQEGVAPPAIGEWSDDAAVADGIGGGADELQMQQDVEANVDSNGDIVPSAGGSALNSAEQVDANGDLVQSQATTGDADLAGGEDVDANGDIISASNPNADDADGDGSEDRDYE